MEKYDKLAKKRKRTFVEAWLTDERYKSWIRKVPSNNTLYFCSICNKNLSCGSTYVSRHADSVCHKNNIKKNSLPIRELCNDDANLTIKEELYNDDNLTIKEELSNDDAHLTIKKARKSKFQLQWLEMEQYKSWLREVPHDKSSFFCLICDKSIAGGISQINCHAESKAHVDKCKNDSTENPTENSTENPTKNPTEVSKTNEDLNTQTQTEILLPFEECKKNAENKFAELIAKRKISYQNAKEILSFFQNIGKDYNVLKSMNMGRTKCTNIITNVLCPIETERVVNRIENTKFTLFIGETSDISDDRWMTFLVRYVDSETLDIRTQLVKLIDIDPKDTNAEKLFLAFKCEMQKLQISFLNIIALSCDDASALTGKYLLFKKKMEEKCPHLLTFSCPCHSAMLAVRSACNKIPVFCEEFIKKIANFICRYPEHSTAFCDLHEYFQETNKTLKSCDKHWCSEYSCIEKLLESWDTIKYYLNEMNEKTNFEEDLLLMMGNIEMKAYFLFLKYILNIFNTFNTFFKISETRIHLLQSKSLNLFSEICQHFLKKEHLKSFSTDVVLSLKENQKFLNEITLGSEYEKYLVELMSQGHEDTVITIRENCLSFYVTAAEEIRKRLPINDAFLSKLHVFTSSVSLYEPDREMSFNDVSFVAKIAIGDFDEDMLKKEWVSLLLDFTATEKQHLSTLNFDNMWKEILQCRPSNNIVKYPTLTSVLNAIRSIPSSNTDPKEVLPLLNDVIVKKHNKISSVSVNAICVVRSALRAKGEKAVDMKIEKKHLSLMSANKLYANAAKKTTKSKKTKES